jgi:hypothetical protein
VRVNVWVVLPAVLTAPILIGYTPPVSGPGVPEMVAVPPPFVVKWRPLGSVPISLREGAGYPDEVTTKVPDVLGANDAASPLVIAGACSTTRVKGWIKVPTVLCAVKSMG